MFLADEHLLLESMDEQSMGSFKDESDILMLKQVKEILPPICVRLIEDPFIRGRLSFFFKLYVKDVREAMQTKLFTELYRSLYSTSLAMWPVSAGMEHLFEGVRDLKKRPLHKLFFEWVAEEVRAVIESLDEKDLQFLVNYSAFQILKNIDISETLKLRETLQPASHTYAIFQVLPKSQNLVLRPLDTDVNISIELNRFLCRSNGDYTFCSKFLRDTMFSYIIDTYDVISKIDKAKAATYEFLPLTVGLFCKDDLKRFIADAISKTHSGRRLTLNAWRCIQSTSDEIWALLVNDSPVELTEPFYQWSKLVWQRTTRNKRTIEIHCSTPDKIEYFLHPPGIRNPGIEEWNEMNISVKVEDLDFQEPRKGKLQSLAESLGMSKHTSSLVMRKCGILPDDFTKYLETGNFANIKHLNLSETRIILNSAEPLGLRYIPRLQTIDFYDCNLGDAGIIILGRELALLKRLKEINIAKNRITAEGLQDLSNSLSSHHGLIALRVQNNNIGPEGGVVLSGWLKRLFLIETLNVSACHLEDIGVKHISKAVVSHVLRQVSMRDNNVTADGSLVFFKNMKSKRMIEHLDYGKNKVFRELEGTQIQPHPDAEASISKLELNSFLLGKEHWSHLNFWSCSLGANRIFQSYRKLHGMKDLVHLCLQSNQIEDTFAEDVGGCLKEHCEHIRHINLRHNRIGNSGASAIADGISGKKKLEELLIDKNQIEEIGIRKLLSASLQVDLSVTLDVSCNNLAKFDIERLVTEHSLQEKPSGGQKYDTDKPNMYVSHDHRLKAQIYM